MVAEYGWWGAAARVVGALLGLAVIGTLAFAALPLGVWVGWRVASGSWMPPELAGEPVAVWRMMAGVLVGSMVFRFGMLLRVRLVMAWQEERDSPW